MAINLTQDIFPHAQDCAVGIGGDGHNASSDIAAYLANTPGLVTTSPQPITIDGLSGLTFDASVAPTWTQTCGESEPAVFTIAGPIADPSNGSTFVSHFVAGDGHARYIALDLSPQHNLLIAVSAPDEASFTDITEAAMPIIESFQFEREVH
jgi:hypothetical protein